VALDEFLKELHECKVGPPAHTELVAKLLMLCVQCCRITLNDRVCVYLHFTLFCGSFVDFEPLFQIALDDLGNGTYSGKDLLRDLVQCLDMDSIPLQCEVSYDLM
jgi:hypothetical protein